MLQIPWKKAQQCESIRVCVGYGHEKLLHIASYVTGFEKIRLPCTQQHDIVFTINQQLYTLANHSANIGAESFSGYFYCGLFPRLIKYPQMLK